MRGRPKNNEEVRRKYTMEFDDSIWYYDLDKFPNGPYLVEYLDPTYDKLERLQTPKFHENGRKKRTTKVDKSKIENAERAYWKEHYKIFPNDIPKRRGRPKKSPKK